MSDYTPLTDFSAKDALLTGDPEKLILGTDFDVELAAIAVAIATKFDTGDEASAAEAQTGTASDKVITPRRIESWAAQNLGLVKDLSDLSSNPSVDVMFFYDKTDDSLKFLTVGAGLAITDTTIAASSVAPVDFSANAGTAATGATTTSESLTWYEEGTWVPNLWDGSLSSSEGQTYSTQVGRFTRIGRVVFYEMNVTLSSLGTLTTSQDVRFGPLPFTATSTSGYVAAGSVGYAAGINAPGDATLSAAVQLSTNYVLVYRQNAVSPGVGVTPLSIAELTSSGSLTISGHYII